ncbi:LPXTG cell wall anchor domain-containing protein, partial [Streptococcus sp. 263_SSPC]
GPELPNTGTANSFLVVIAGLLVVVGTVILVSRKKA